MKKYVAITICALALMVFGAGLFVINMIRVSGSNSSKGEDGGITRVSLNYQPDESENDLVSSNIKEQIDILGEDDVKEASEVAQITAPAKTTTVTTPTTPSTPTPKPPSSGNCPASTLNCIPCNINDGHWACRVEPGEKDGYLGWSCQNNNPGNIRYSSARISYITKKGGPAPCGERVDSRGGTYMIFSTYNDGRNGLKAYMKAVADATHTAYGECADGDCSLSYVFSKYAPGDPNYASNIASKLSVTTDTSLQWVIAHKFSALLDAIQQKEGFFVQ